MTTLVETARESNLKAPRYILQNLSFLSLGIPLRYHTQVQDRRRDDGTDETVLPVWQRAVCVVPRAHAVRRGPLRGRGRRAPRRGGREPAAS